MSSYFHIDSDFLSFLSYFQRSGQKRRIASSSNSDARSKRTKKTVSWIDQDDDEEAPYRPGSDVTMDQFPSTASSVSHGTSPQQRPTPSSHSEVYETAFPSSVSLEMSVRSEKSVAVDEVSDQLSILYFKFSMLIVPCLAVPP